MRKINKIIVHWSASHKETNVDDIKRWHLQRGFTGIGYHRVILYTDNNKVPWGSIVKLGRPIESPGAHTLGHNKDSIGVCVIGNTDYSISEKQKEALINTIKVLKKRFNIQDVYCHRDLNNTQCPGKEIEAIIRGEFK